MKYWRFCCSVFATFVAVTSVLISPAEGIDSQDGKENEVNDGSKNNTPLINTHAVIATTTSVPIVVEPCGDSSGYHSDKCSPDLPCDQLPKYCFDCHFNCTCIYGQEVEVHCEVAKKAKSAKCEDKIRMNMTCRYCYQTEPWEHTCEGRDSCQAISSPRELFTSNCTVNSDVLCLGNRSFLKRLPCNWTSGYKWSTALLLSITLGGFGADRFYLGLWQEGIGKLFSFGGLGVWTIMDVILIAIRYLGPADGSLYI